MLLDILQRTGLKGYEAFLESLELDYPDVYRKITGKEPARVFSVLIGKLYIFSNVLCHVKYTLVTYFMQNDNCSDNCYHHRTKQSGLC